MTHELSCVQCRDYLIEFTAGTLPHTTAQAVERHLAACADCQRELAAWRALNDAMRLRERQIPLDTRVTAGWARLEAALPQLPLEESQGERRNRQDIWDDTMSDRFERDESADQFSDELAATLQARTSASPSAPSRRRAHNLRSRLIPAIAAVLLIALGGAIFSLFGRGRFTSHPGPVAQHPACAPSQINAHLPADARLYDIQMLSPNEGWAVGSIDTHGVQDSNLNNSTTLILHYSHCQWTQAPFSQPGTLLGLSMISPTEGWAVGLDESVTGMLLHYSGGQWQRAALPPVVGQRSIEGFQMVSATEGWLMVSGTKDQQGNLSSSQIYHLLNGTWSPVTLPDQSQYQNVVLDGAFAPGKAWIEGDINSFSGNTPPIPHLFLYDNGTLTPMSLPMPAVANAWDGAVVMHTPQDGWLAVGQETTDQWNSASPWLSHALLHFDGTSWSQSSLLNSDPRLQTATSVRIFASGEGMAFLGSVPPPDIVASNLLAYQPSMYPYSTQALWLHNGKWQQASMPSQGIWGVPTIVQVSPTEYWAIPFFVGNTTDSLHAALLHFDNGVWTAYS